MKIRTLFRSSSVCTTAWFLTIASASAATVDFPGQPLEIVKAYRYLEARSADFTLEFDTELDSKKGNVLNTKLYARLWATRVIREEAAHKLAESMLRTAMVVRTPEGHTAFRNAEARKTEADVFNELSQQYISGLPLVDDVIEALGHMDAEAMTAKYKEVHRDLLARVPSIYKAERRAKFENNWGQDSEVSDWRKRAKTEAPAAIIKSMDDAIRRYARSQYNSTREPASTRTTAAAGRYGPSTGATGNLTGREFPSKMWALTYDDGPAKQTDEILTALAKRNMKATFFWLSKNAPSYATTAVARAKNEGHGLANHSATHAQLTKVSSAALDREILSSTSDLEAIYGQKLGFFRLPYGAGRNDTSIRTRIEKAGLVHVYWNVDTLDWQDRNPTTVYQRTMKQVNQQGRGVILFHDIHSQTVTASARVMDDLKSQGSRVVTMQEALSVLNGEIP
ncbi:MAG: polysaccharide deacetylase family protein [Deltaproteobacteria bacterium]|nr:polysaccharide deacetylase family protein [Deltaproteobacteria bacterium]